MSSSSRSDRLDEDATGCQSQAHEEVPNEKKSLKSQSGASFAQHRCRTEWLTGDGVNNRSGDRQDDNSTRRGLREDEKSGRITMLHRTTEASQPAPTHSRMSALSLAALGVV